MRVQFILKKNQTYGFKSYTRRSSGLWNSAKFIAEALAEKGVHSGITEVTDNNDIDAAVTEFKPDICIIEALWVVPEKFDVLKRLHPNVKWFVHLHSNMPFLALEGVAIDWLFGYAERDVQVIANSRESCRAVRTLIGDKVTFLPNIFLADFQPPVYRDDEDPYVDIACMGAVRPLKNQLIQAIAAIRFAQEKGKLLRFHINSTRVETNGDPVLQNLRALFKSYSNDAELVEHPWLEPSDLQALLGEMDMGLQVSLSETFNIVTADYLAAGLPVVTSEEVKWVSMWSKANCDDPDDIVKIMRRAWDTHWLIRWNQVLLVEYSADATKDWLRFVHKNHRRLR